MCGIAGLWQSGGSVSPRALESALSEIVHRGPDDAGTWQGDDGALLLGHRRLSIIDLSPAGHQPMVSRAGDWVITYNGEIYNWPDLRAELAAGGVTFRGGSDSEILVEALSAWGLTRTLERLVGMFAFAAWNTRERRLFLVRDRFGEKPLYYTFQNGRWAFASQLRALRGIDGFRFETDKVGAAFFFQRDYIPAPRTIYAGVFKVAPAHCVELTAGGEARASRYWALPQGPAEPDSRRSFLDAAAEAETLLLEAVRQQMVADVPVGAFLSGGVDSSVVVALMQTRANVPVHSFSIGYVEEAFDESRFAEEVARHLGTRHTTLRVSPADALAVIPQLAEIYDEPFADSSAVPTTLVSRLAREYVTVALTGDGGDEVFGGYDRYRALASSVGLVRSRSGLARALNTRMSAAAATSADILGLTSWRERLARRADLYASLDPAILYDKSMTRWPEARRWLVEQGKHAPDPASDSLLRLATSADLQGYLPGNSLVKVDRAAMSASLETRVPLLDHRLVEFAWRQPDAFKMSATESKRLLRAILYKHVPRELIERPKMGFGVPISDWLRRELREWAESLLFDSPIRHPAIPAPRLLRRVWQAHQDGRIDAGYRLWNLLMFQSWQARWMR